MMDEEEGLESCVEIWNQELKVFTEENVRKEVSFVITDYVTDALHNSGAPRAFVDSLFDMLMNTLPTHFFEEIHNEVWKALEKRYGPVLEMEVSTFRCRVKDETFYCIRYMRRNWLNIG